MIELCCCLNYCNNNLLYCVAGFPASYCLHPGPTYWFFTFPTFTNLSLSLTNQSFFQSNQKLLLANLKIKVGMWSFVQLFWLALILDCNFTSFSNYFLLLHLPTLAFWSIIAVFSFSLFNWPGIIPESPTFHLKFLSVKALIYGLVAA